MFFLLLLKESCGIKGFVLEEKERLSLCGLVREVSYQARTRVQILL